MNISFRPAAPNDIPLILSFMENFYGDQQIPFDAERQQSAVRTLIENDALGVLQLVRCNVEIVGYFAVCFGFSLEYQGRDAFLDELFIDAAFRGRGIGKAAMEAALLSCEAAGVTALHLEVERENERAAGLYRRMGFLDNQRRLLTRRIAERNLHR